ncbi:MAG: hypothetical protein IJJ85_06585 [Clostridia bacterium]|nr:hypothetical protein [Clostridia bacterium]
MICFLGLDGGGSGSTAVLCDETGAVVRRAKGGGLNFLGIGMDAARENLRALVSDVTEGSAYAVAAAGIGCAALDGIADEKLTEALCGGTVPCKAICLDSDVSMALFAVKERGCAAAAICGTGSMAAGRLPDGTVIHTGGWGARLGDEGSGYRLSVEAVRAALSYADGVGEHTALYDAVMDFFRCRTKGELIARFYDPPVSTREVAAFAPVFFGIAAKGDHAANTILNCQVLSFTDTVSALMRRLPQGTPLGVWGGIFEHHAPFRDLFIQTLSSRFPQTEVSLLPCAPEVAAAKRAMRLILP